MSRFNVNLNTKQIRSRKETFKGFIVSCGETTFFVDVWLGCKFLFYVSMGRRGDAKRVNYFNVEIPNMSPVARREGAGRKRE